jgi:Xaa-Pro aminopeptidase
MRGAGLGAMVVSHPADVRWLSGFTGSNGAVALLATERGVRGRLFTDGRYTVQAKDEVSGLGVTIAQKAAAGAACEWLESQGAVLCGFDSATVTVAALEGLRRSVSSKVRRGFFKAAPGLVARLREVKDAGEVEALRRAAALGCSLYEQMLSVIEAGMTEVVVAAELEHRARMAGAEAMSFETIVASGLRGALPHGRATDKRLVRGEMVTLDFGVILGGYCSDMTRTVYLGHGSRVSRNEAAQRHVFEAVLQAQEAAVAAVRPGVLCADVDEAAREVLRSAGLEKEFSHSTGHGVGLEIHEGPRIGTKQKQVLEPGMVITIEPGAYLAGKYGVRIEDMVLVTSVGAEVLTPSPKVWTEL